MGTAGSRMKVPLVPQPKPVRATRLSMVSTQATSLSVELTGTNTTFRLLDAHSGAVFQDLQPDAANGRRRTVCSPNGVPLAVMKQVAKRRFAVYDVGANEDAPPLFHIEVIHPPGYPPVVVAEFKDVATGERCRLLCEGHSDHRVVLVLLERGNNFTPIQKEKNDQNPNAAVVARIRRPKTEGVVFEGREKMFVEAEAGVDLTLLSMVWCVRYDLYFRTVADGGAFTHYIKADLLDDGAMVR